MRIQFFLSDLFWHLFDISLRWLSSCWTQFVLKTWEFLAPLRTWGAYWTNRGAQRSGQLAVGNCNIVQLQSVERWWKHVKKLSGSSHSSSSSSRRPKVLQISLSFNVFDFTIIENFLIPSVLGTDLRTRSTCPFATEGHMWSSLLCGRAAMCNLVANEFIWMAHGDLSPANWWIYLVCDPVILYNCCKTNSSGSPHCCHMFCEILSANLGEVLCYDLKLLAAGHEGKGQKSALIE